MIFIIFFEGLDVKFIADTAKHVLFISGEKSIADSHVEKNIRGPGRGLLGVQLFVGHLDHLLFQVPF